MNNEPNKPIPAQELTEKELESITGGGKVKDGGRSFYTAGRAGFADYFNVDCFGATFALNGTN